MLFNSLNFLLFFIIVFSLYWFVFGRRLAWQNLFLMLASYVFYAFWDWRFLFLLIFSTCLDFVSGIQIYRAKSDKLRRLYLVLSVGINLGFLGVFKYYNFFADSLARLLEAGGIHTHWTLLSIVLPVGISFYTFHGLSYVFDIYNRKIEPSYNFVNYSLFVSFFPLLVAGPIERATHLLPQVEKPRQFSYEQACDGITQILWGLFKKVVIADGCAQFANQIFNESGQFGGITLFAGAALFAFQIYGDFSGYSDMAMGVSKLLGFELLRNFNYPYFSRSIPEFWRRWHISLSSWFRDYLYIPLGGSRGGRWHSLRNLIIIFVVSGFWHGANWTFVVWGLLNALYYIPSLLFKSNRDHMNTVAEDRALPNFKELMQMMATFIMTVFAWVFFRAPSVQFAFSYCHRILLAAFDLNAYKEMLTYVRWTVGLPMVLILLCFTVLEWVGRRELHPLLVFRKHIPKPARHALYYVILIVVFLFAGKQQQFIYFQF
ncbi:MAG: MBOAT family O-acyltransferase [Chitinophagaceae bacterium]